MMRYTIDSFFSGVGGLELGFELTNRFTTIYANEFDKNAQKTYKLNHQGVFLDERDIRLVSPEDIPDCDVMMGGFPCQAFSVAGKRQGFNDERGTLFFEMLRMIRAKKPRVVFFENVKNLLSHNQGKTFKTIYDSLEEAGYTVTWKVLNSKDYNLPQNRERVYIVGFKFKSDYDHFIFPEATERKKTLHDVIDFKNQKEERYYYRQKKQDFYDQLALAVTRQDRIYQWRRRYVRENKQGLVPTLTANMGGGGHNVPIILTDAGEIRKLTPRETFNVQGFPENFSLPKISNTQLYKQAGNSVAVPVVRAIAEKIAATLDRKE